MKFTLCSLLTALGLLFSLLVVESAGADCLKQADASVEQMIEPVQREADQTEVNKVDADMVHSEVTEPGEPERAGEERVNTAKAASETMQKAPTEPPELSLEQLVARLKKTKAIGFFTKLAIRSDVFDFQQSVESYRKKKIFEENVEALKGRFNGLLLKILALLDRDPVLSRDIHLARDSIWRSLVEVKS